MKRLALTAALILVLLIGHAATNPLWWSKDAIRNWLLKKAPIGSSVAQVDALIAREGWGKNLDFNSYYYKEGWPVPGARVLGASLGDHWEFLTRVQVHAYWGFTVDEKLIAVKVDKSGEGPLP